MSKSIEIDMNKVYPHKKIYQSDINRLEAQLFELERKKAQIERRTSEWLEHKNNISEQIQKIEMERAVLNSIFTKQENNRTYKREMLHLFSFTCRICNGTHDWSNFENAIDKLDLRYLPKSLEKIFICDECKYEREIK